MFKSTYVFNTQATYGKSHHPKEEAGKRANFIARQRMIEKHNSENKDWQMGHNKFSDMVLMSSYLHSVD